VSFVLFVLFVGSCVVRLRVDDHPTRLWTLHRDGREVACLARLVPYGIEIDIAYDGAPVATRVFDNGDEALAWAKKTRAEREARGWRAD
jgi:hypothetical protein